MARTLQQLLRRQVSCWASSIILHELVIKGFIIYGNNYLMTSLEWWPLKLNFLSSCRFLDPIILGKYPAEMNEILGPDLLAFSTIDMERLKSGLDFIGINHYTSVFVKDCIFSACEPGRGSSKTEGFALKSPQINGISIGEPVWNFILHIAFNYWRPQNKFNFGKRKKHIY